ncbi:hypothetical protein Dsin_017185 [Dipteronia sinensis]|uniref:Legume lectin domain-containing protein n=1 Tax=Dipteronia sinensis TaxID=43782 RepID=A0AAE0E6A6_9ROSI|nr:hypothetical protein Dsin_017185 [Dipteronia sinensis]
MTMYLIAVTLFIINLNVLSAEPSCPIGLNTFDEVPRCQSNFYLYGSAKAVNGGSSIQLTTLDGSSAGRVMYKKPIKLVECNPQKFASFSTNFSFSLSNQSADGLAFYGSEWLSFE